MYASIRIRIGLVGASRTYSLVAATDSVEQLNLSTNVESVLRQTEF